MQKELLIFNMTSEIQNIARDLKETLDGKPWFGRPVYAILNEIHPAYVYKKPNENSHSLIELLYHMLTWAQFTLNRIEKKKEENVRIYEEALDWRVIDPIEHTWSKGVQEFKTVNEKIFSALQTKQDSLLEEKVDYRQYNFRHLLKGFNQHNIYHLGQLAFLNKYYSAKE